MLLMQKIKSWKEVHPSRSFAFLERKTNIKKTTLFEITKGKSRARISTAITILAEVCDSIEEVNRILCDDYPEYKRLISISI